MKERHLMIIQVTIVSTALTNRSLIMTDDLLSKCVIDTSKRKVYLYSDNGKENVVSCETVDEFMNVLNFVRDKVEEERVFYSDPL